MDVAIPCTIPALSLGSLGEAITTCSKVSEAKCTNGISLVLAPSPIFSVSLVCVPASGRPFSLQATHAPYRLNSPKQLSASPLMLPLPTPVEILPWGWFSYVWSCAPFRNQAGSCALFWVDLWLSFLAKLQM